VNTTILALSEAGILYQVSWSRWFNNNNNIAFCPKQVGVG
jgi:hypothetical protein